VVYRASRLLGRRRAGRGITDDTDLRESGILSSLWIIKLASFLEERYQIRFDAADFGDSNFFLIADIERLIRSKLEQAS